MSDYHRLSAAAKQARNRAAVRPNPTRCPACEAAVQPRDLLGHLERCPGPADLHPADDRVTWAQALALGVPGSTLARWAIAGDVRFDVVEGEKRYVLRDLAKMQAARLRRSQKRKRRPPGRPEGRGGVMSEPLGSEVAEQVHEMAAAVGGLEPLARKLDVPVRTLRRALAGANVSRGTRALIEAQLAAVRSTRS